MFRNKLKGSEYANIVTVFAVIVAVLYSTESPDLWDMFIGLLSIGLGIAFVDEASRHNDFWFSFVTAALIGLGVLSILEVVVYVVHGFPEPTPQGKGKFIEELISFVCFLVITGMTHFFIVRRGHSK